MAVFCIAQHTTGPTRDPKPKEYSVCIHLTKCKLVNALLHKHSVEESSGAQLSGLAFSFHKSLVMHSKEINSVCVEIFYSSLSDLCIPMFSSNIRTYIHVYIVFLISVSKFHKNSRWKVLRLVSSRHNFY